MPSLTADVLVLALIVLEPTFVVLRATATQRTVNRSC